MIARIRNWARGLWAVVRPYHADEELTAEIRFHLDMLAEQFQRQGMGQEEARRAARRSFGGEDQVKETIRERRSARWLDDGIRDTSLAVRQMVRQPGFALVVVLTLALGIGANTAVFSVVNSVLLQPLPNESGDRLVRIAQHAPGLNQADIRFSVKEIQDYQAQFQSLDAVVEFHAMTFNLIGEGDPEEVQTGVVSWNYFEALGMMPVLGRSFTEAEEAGVGEAVLVFSHEYWNDRFGGDPSVVGRQFEMNDRIHTVIGILPPAARYPVGVDVYMPVSHCPMRSSDAMKENRNSRMMMVVGRMGPGATLHEVQAEAAGISGRLGVAMPDVYVPERSGFVAEATMLKEELVEQARPILWILMATTGFVLLIACANVANLMLARLSRRERELAVRAALGARRGRLLRQLLAESLVLATAAGVVGLGIAYVGVDVLSAIAGRFTVRAGEVRMDLWVLGFTVLVAVGTGVLFGVLPALIQKGDSAQSIREAGVGTGSLSSHLTQSALVVVQVAASFVLLVGAGLLVRSFVNLQAVDPGYQSENVLTARVAYPIMGKYTDFDVQEQLWTEVIEEVQSLPGVASAGVGNLVPLNGGGTFGQQYQVVGQPRDFDDNIQAFDRTVTDGYFPSLGIPLLQGRLFGLDDARGGQLVVIINRTFADVHFAGRDPIGQSLQPCNFNGCDEAGAAVIVGVVGDVRFRGLELDPGSEVYGVSRQVGYGSTIVIRSQGDPTSLRRAVADIIQRIDPELPVVDVRTLAEVRSEWMAPRRLTLTLMGVFAGAAMLVTLTGIFGLMAYLVGQRRRELAIRMAFGAGQGSVVLMILMRAAAMVGAGLVLGMILSPFLNRALAEFLWGVGATDLVTFFGVAAILSGAALIACYIPARRAAGVSPLLSLKSD